MNASRQEILESLRRNLPPVATLPELSGAWIEYPDPVRQFAETLTAVGGECRVVEDFTELKTAVRALVDASGADPARCCSLVGNLDIGGRPVSESTPPHDLADLQVVFATGRLAVAENGAVWIDGGDVPQRVALVIPRHLVVIVRKSAIVHNMHQAYERVGCDRSEFGVFISGPSKTADIEQSLVIGAQGAKQLTVLVIARDQ